MLRVWGRKNSFNVQKVMWVIGELNLDCDHIELGGRYGGLDAAEFLAKNPNGLIPVLDHDGTVIWESHSIVRYLSATFGVGTLWPEDPGKRSLSDRWMDWTLAVLQPEFMGVFWGFYRTPEDQRDWTDISRKIEGCARLYSILDQHLADRSFVAGEALSIGDIPVGATLYRYFELEIERPSLPRVEAYYKRLQKRSAYRECVMVSFDELKGRLDF